MVKADGLALGKGVMICQDLEEAKEAVHSIMEDKIFGASGNQVVVEEFITGPEVSVLSFTDGKTVVPMVSSKDHKRAYDGDRGLNTGGMGTISLIPITAGDGSAVHEGNFSANHRRYERRGKTLPRLSIFRPDADPGRSEGHRV